MCISFPLPYNFISIITNFRAKSNRIRAISAIFKNKKKLWISAV